MSSKRLAAGVVVLAALLIVGSATTVLFAARSQERPSGKVEIPAQENPPAAKGAGGTVGGFGVDAGDAAEAAEIKMGVGVGYGLSAKPTPKPTPVITPAAGKSVLGQPQLTQKSASKSTAQGRPDGTGGKASNQGQVYTWYDGDQAMKVAVQDDLGSQSTSSNAESDDVVAVKGHESIVRKQPGQDSNLQPVFKAESGGELMTLPGGVLVALDPNWDEDRVQQFFSSNGITEDRLTELGFVDNGFLVSTEPGFPSLNLANDLAHQDGVVSSEPNWSRERETR